MAYEFFDIDNIHDKKELRKAYKKQMKKVHPDSGGTPEMAARLNNEYETILNQKLYLDEVRNKPMPTADQVFAGQTAHTQATYQNSSFNSQPTKPKKSKAKEFTEETFGSFEEFYNKYKDQMVKDKNGYLFRSSKNSGNWNPMKIRKGENGDLIFEHKNTRSIIKNTPQETKKSEEKEKTQTKSETRTAKQEKKMSSQEAFDKYGPRPDGTMPDEFYTTQGLDPQKEREKVDEINKRTKEKKEKADKKPAEEHFEPKSEPKIDKTVDSVGNPKVSEITHDVTEEVEKTVENSEKITKNASETVKKAVNTAEKHSTSMQTKTISGSGSKALAAPNSPPPPNGPKSKGGTPPGGGSGGKLALALAIAAGVAIASGEHNAQKKANTKFTGNMTKKEKKKEEKRLAKERKMQGYANTTMMYTGMEQQMAADISGYHYGKHMTGFMNA